jgi:hypothetical protein
VRGQTLEQEYQVKKDYKKANITINEKDSAMIIFGKIYKYEESYYNLLFVVMPNGDYVISPSRNDYDYMDRICLEEHRYKVCLIGGMQELKDGFITTVHRAIWLLRSQRGK